MAMTEARIAEVKRRPAEERARRHYPEDFPGLPPVPAGRYTDPEFAELEREAVFGRSWLFVAHGDQFRQPGDYLLVEHLAKPVILVRGQDGEVRAHLNACKHRGAALLTEPCGNTGRRMTCPYHSWVYDLDGTLVGYPDANNFRELDPACVDLTSVRCESWGPLVFICFDDEAPPLLEFLDSVGEDLSEMADLDGRLHLAGTTFRDVPVNWKLPVDANIETYHVNYVHKESAALGLRQATTGIWLLPNGHSRMFIQTHEGITFDTPIPPLFERVGDLPLNGTFSYHVFPNLSIVFGGPGFVFFITNWPEAPNESSYHVHWCGSRSPEDPDHGAFLTTFVGLNQGVLFEDLTVLPGIQESIDAGALESVQLSYQERRIYHVHEAIDRVIGPEQVPDELRVPQVLGPHVEV